MDEYNRGVDPEVTQYFKKIVKSAMAAIMWLLGIGTAGFFFKLAIVKTTWHWYHVAFYIASVLTLLWLNFFLYKVWTRK